MNIPTDTKRSADFPYKLFNLEGDVVENFPTENQPLPPPGETRTALQFMQFIIDKYPNRHLETRTPT